MITETYLFCLYLDMLSEEDEAFVEFGMGGICNLCLGKFVNDFVLHIFAPFLQVNELFHFSSLIHHR